MGFSFHGKSSTSMGIPTRMSVENRIPEIRNSTDTIEGRHGIVDFGETLSERKIEISCFIPPGKTDRDLLELKDKIVDWLNPDHGLCPLILDREPGRQYYARLEEGLSFEKMIGNTGTFNLTFFCPDPFGYAIEDEVFTLTENTTIRRTKGNVVSHPVYEIRGAISDKSNSITFTVNGEKVTICGPLADSEVLYLDTDDMTARIVTQVGEQRNALGNMLDFHFPYLTMGENMIALGTNGGTFTSLIVHAKSRWL